MAYDLNAQIQALRDIRALASHGAGVKVAVLDGGIDQNHPDLSRHGLVNKTEGATLHGTAVASLIAGETTGIAPGVALIEVPVFQENARGDLQGCSQLVLAKAIRSSLEAGAQVINVSGANLSNSGHPSDEIRRAVDACEEAEVQIVASLGNDGLMIDTVPAAVDGVLAVGAHDIQGEIAAFNNLGPRLQRKAVFAPGVDIRFQSDGHMTRISGSSFATPIVAGTAALIRAHQPGISNADLREIILEASVPYAVSGNFEQANLSALSRLDFVALLEKLGPTRGHVITQDKSFSERKDSPMSEENIDTLVAPAEYAHNEVAAEAAAEVAPAEVSPADASPTPQQAAPAAPAVPAAPALPLGKIHDPAANTFVHDPAAALVQPQALRANVAAEDKIFAFGTIGYDFANETNRDYFQQAMYSLGEQHPHLKPLVPENEVSMARFLSFRDANGNQPYMDASTALDWVLKVDGIPVYAIRPQDQFAILEFAKLLEYLIEQTGLTPAEMNQTDVDTPTLMTRKNEAADGVQKIDRVSIAGNIIGQTRLYNGHVVPIVSPILRGMFAWNPSALAEAALGDSPKKSEVEGLRNFLERIYYELRNKGSEPSHRALNFAATNAHQAAEVFVDALDRRMELNAISVERSPVSRPGSDFWDVIMEFFDPENKDRRARRLYRYTIDVSGMMPVTFGPLRSWNAH